MSQERAKEVLARLGFKQTGVSGCGCVTFRGGEKSERLFPFVGEVALASDECMRGANWGGSGMAIEVMHVAGRVLVNCGYDQPDTEADFHTSYIDASARLVAASAAHSH